MAHFNLFGGQVSATHKTAGLGSLTDQNSNTTSFSYDTLNQLTGVTDPLGKIHHVSYDAMGNLTSRTDFNQAVTVYTYNNVDKLTKVQYPGANQVAFVYDAVGRVTQMNDYTGDTSYRYDVVGRMTSYTNGQGLSVGYAYDNAGNLTALTYPGGKTVNYTYGKDNRLLSAGSASFTYDQNGNLTKKGDAAYEYDYENRLKKVTTSQGTWEYDYDGVGNRVGLKVGGDTRRFLLDPTGMTKILARYYDPEVGRFITKDPIGFDGGVNLYGYVANSPINYIDPPGLSMSDSFGKLVWKVIEEAIVKPIVKPVIKKLAKEGAENVGADVVQQYVNKRGEGVNSNLCDKGHTGINPLTGQKYSEHRAPTPEEAERQKDIVIQMIEFWLIGSYPAY